MKRFLMIVLFLVVNTFTATAQTSPNEVMPLVYITDPAEVHDFDLYVMNPQTGDILFKSTTPNKDCPLAVSPDGKAIIYQQLLSGESPVKFAHYFVDLTTGEQRQIDLGDNLLQQSTVKWDQNADKLYFVLNKYKDGRLYEYDLEANTLKEVARSEAVLHLMRLGTKIVYWSANDRQLTIIDLNGNSYELGYSDLFSMGKPSPDGQYLIREVKEEEYDYILSGLTDKDRITISDARNRLGLSWRPDSQAVFYPDLDKNFVVFDLERREKTLFPSPITLGVVSMSSYWSPDGRYIAYMADHGDVSHSNENELGLVDTKTGKVTQVASYNDPDNWGGTFIQWIDNHQFIYFNGNHGSNVVASEQRAVDIFKYDVTTQTQINLTNTPDLNESTECWYG